MTVMRPIQRGARDHRQRLGSQLQTLAGEHWRVLSHRSRDWASATYVGARHVFVLAAHRETSQNAIDGLSKEISDYDFALTRAFVNEAVVADRRVAHNGEMRAVVELLVIEDG